MSWFWRGFAGSFPRPIKGISSPFLPRKSCCSRRSQSGREVKYAHAAAKESGREPGGCKPRRGQWMYAMGN